MIGVHNLYEVSQFFKVYNNHALKAIEHYKSKFGLSIFLNNHLIKSNHYKCLSIMK